MRTATASLPASIPQPLGHAASGLTDLELTWIEQRLEHWLRFGRVAAERIVSRRTRVVSFRPGAVFGFVRWGANDFGTIFSSISVIAAVTPGSPYATHPFVRPGGDILLRIDGWPKVQQVLAAIDAIEAAGIDPCETAPDHWRHIGSHLGAGLPFRPYCAERHRAWLQRKAIAP
ncbi:MAG: DUF2840 domain-containing protein [Sphingopyxis sp.]|jgi:hypothetical protein|uniref:DUF2840 domain-containing protein n=1 Tax=Sphingopyxis sp. TaxID=1908224 RepID=UPI002ABC09B0|nr:DUF2840 domain-containing protein [Sphingopyxis sp.]MDZ3831915.1 DUF2840 domain-containing protein [Sphingopyxis sp.]